ncbi:metallophosphoesterase [Eubacteriales bacterium OttesenSCG-928-A19]|nr:metallophosphoesterase [Eubacteriales bacterium OttesenSCG-928-A19]
MSERSKGRLMMAEALVLCLCFVMTAWAFYEGLVDREYALASPKLTNAEPIRVVVLADLHSHAHGGDQQPLIRRVEAMRPDLICLVGDIADDYNPIRGTELLLEGIVDLAPCLYVTGNHEYWSRIEPIREVFRAYDVPILENEATIMEIKGQTLYIHGLDDPDYTRARDYGGFFEDTPPVPEGLYSILLAHRPDPIEVYAAQGFDLALSGHAHGGQVRIPLLLNGLYAPDQGWRPTYAGGVYEVGGTTMVVSRGLSYYPNLPRIFNPPEVVLITLKAGPKASE